MNVDLSNIQHPHTRTPSGALVLALNRGSLITAEDEAMLQALYSRDPQSVYTHLEKLANVGSGKFMGQYYVGYGHKSIGDCGDITIFIEGVSMLAAKAIQDWQLYSGQEVSTRYVDFSNQPFFFPSENRDARFVLDALRHFYVTHLTAVEKHVAEQFPIKEGEKESIYTKAIQARAFDIMRAFLPAGALTSLSWHANLRQTADALMYLRHHPLGEVRDIASAMEKVLQEASPNSFGHKQYTATEKYNAFWMNEEYYFNPEVWPEFDMPANGILIDWDLFREHDFILSSRPPKTELPKQLNECGTLRVDMLLDFGSYRDIARQRSVVQRMPLLTTRFGFEEWYLDQLPKHAREIAEDEILPQIEEFSAGYLAVREAQYATPMGYRVPLRMTGGIASWTYIAELRATPFVHPTLQTKARKIGVELKKYLGHNFALHVDQSEAGRFDVRRGNQDITPR